MAVEQVLRKAGVPTCLILNSNWISKIESVQSGNGTSGAHIPAVAIGLSHARQLYALKTIKHNAKSTRTCARWDIVVTLLVLLAERGIDISGMIIWAPLLMFFDWMPLHYCFILVPSGRLFTAMDGKKTDFATHSFLTFITISYKKSRDGTEAHPGWVRGLFD